MGDCSQLRHVAVWIGRFTTRQLVLVVAISLTLLKYLSGLCMVYVFHAGITPSNGGLASNWLALSYTT